MNILGREKKTHEEFENKFLIRSKKIKHKRKFAHRSTLAIDILNVKIDVQLSSVSIIF